MAATHESTVAPLTKSRRYQPRRRSHRPRVKQRPRALVRLRSTRYGQGAAYEGYVRTQHGLVELVGQRRIDRQPVGDLGRWAWPTSEVSEIRYLPRAA